MNIPKISHRIWFGEPFPDNYRNYLQKLAELNPSYTTKLWSDPDSMSDEAYNNLQKFCAEKKVTLCNIRLNAKLINFDIILWELNTAKKDLKYKRLHYVRAADVARISILYQEGGNYSDTDSEALESFPDMTSKYGILLKMQHGFEKDTYNFYKVSNCKYQYYFSNILYDFMACSSEHPLFKTASEITQLDYKTYFASQNRKWEHSNNGTDLAYGTVKLTGSSLKYALNHHYQSGSFYFDNPIDLFLNLDSIMSSRYDKSWLEGFVSDSKSEHSHLNLFLNEINKARLQRFHAQDHGEHPELQEENSLQEAPHPITSSLSVFSNIFKSGLLKKESDVTLPVTIPAVLNVQRYLLQSEISMTKFDHPEYKFQFDDASYKEKIKQTYKKHGGGLVAIFNIFTRNANKSSTEIIKILEKRSAGHANKISASKKTLSDLRELSCHNKTP